MLLYLSKNDNKLSKGMINMENAKIEKIRKAAGVTANVLNVLKIVMIVVMVLCFIGGIGAMIISADDGTPEQAFRNTVRVRGLLFFAQADEVGSPLTGWLNLKEPNVIAGLNFFAAVVIAAMVLAVVIILRKTFLEIRDSDTPFREEVLKRLKITGILVTVIALNYAIGIGLIIGLTFWCFYRIFDYGIELQKNEDETL